MHRLLILGSLMEFSALARMARARGYYTVVCDGYPKGPAKKEAHAAYDVDVRDTAALANLCKKEQIDGLITSFSDLLMECMVKTAAAAGLPCYLAPRQLPYYRNKAAMKELLARLGIPTPKFCCLEKDFPDSALEDFSFPVVTKPLDMYGSRGLYVLHSPGEVRAAFHEICETSRIKKILVEEYHAGFEFNLMCWVHKGNVRPISLADREKTPIPTREVPISSRNVYPSRLTDQVLEEAVGILSAYAAATGQTEGALSMQFFWSPGTAVQVCEIAGRFFGYEHELVEIAGGPSIEALLLDSVYEPSSLEKTFSRLDPHLPKVAATLYFHGREMTIASQAQARSLMRLPGVLSEGTTLFYREGERITRHGQPYTARYYLAGDTREEVDALSETIFSKISVTDPSGKEILYRNVLPDYACLP